MIENNYWWERINKTPSEKKTVHEFMIEQNFTWKVLTLPCFTFVNGKYVEIEKHRVFARSDDLKPIYVVKKQFKLLDNEECFKIADEFKKKFPSSKFISCGDFLQQKKSYLTLLLKKIKIENDEFSVYVTITNGFDGRNAINCIVNLVRDKDFSVFQMFDEYHKNIWTLGRKNITQKFNHISNELEIYLGYAQNLIKKMNSIQIDLNDTITPIFSINLKKSKSVNSHLAEEKEYIREIYLKNNGRSVYDLYMAMSNYYCHYKSHFKKKSNADIRFDFAMCGYFYNLYNYGKYLIKKFNI